MACGLRSDASAAGHVAALRSLDIEMACRARNLSRDMADIRRRLKCSSCGAREIETLPPGFVDQRAFAIRQADGSMLSGQEGGVVTFPSRAEAQRWLTAGDSVVSYPPEGDRADCP